MKRKYLMRFSITRRSAIKRKLGRIRRNYVRQTIIFITVTSLLQNYGTGVAVYKDCIYQDTFVLKKIIYTVRFFKISNNYSPFRQAAVPSKSRLGRQKGLAAV